MAVGRDHLRQLRLPAALGQLAGKACLDHPDHDPHRGRGAGRGAEQGNEGGVGCRDDLRSEFEHAPAGLVPLDHLDPLARIFEAPIGFRDLGKESPERGKSLALGLQNLADQVARQIEVIPADGHQGTDIVQADGFEKIQPGSVLQELGRKSGIGTEQQGSLPVDDSGVEMGHRHRRGADGGLAIDLRIVPLCDLGLVAAQPDAAHGKAGITLRLGNLGILQQRQRAAAGAQEYELRPDGPFSAAGHVLDGHVPAAVGLAAHMLDPRLEMRGEAAEGLEISQKIVRERAVVHIGTDRHIGGGNGLFRGAPLHDQRRPLFDLLLVFRILHPLIAAMGRQRRVPLLQESNIVGTPDEAHMRNRVNEGSGRGDRSLLDQIGP